MAFETRRLEVVGVGGTLREGAITDGPYGRRLDSLGEMVVGLAGGVAGILAAREERAGLAGVAG
jgi:hypothetical protein